MSTNYYVADNGQEHIGKFTSLGRFCSVCPDQFVGSRSCVVDPAHKLEDLNRVGWIWSMRPTRFALFTFNQGILCTNESGEEIYSVDLLSRIENCYRQFYDNIGQNFS